MINKEYGKYTIVCDICEEETTEQRKIAEQLYYGEYAYQGGLIK